MSIVRHVAARIWKNITGAQLSDNAQSVPTPRPPTFFRLNCEPRATLALRRAMLAPIACRSLGQKTRQPPLKKEFVAAESIDEGPL
jgi:hypothetical protein